MLLFDSQHRPWYCTQTHHTWVPAHLSTFCLGSHEKRFVTWRSIKTPGGTTPLHWECTVMRWNSLLSRVVESLATAIGNLEIQAILRHEHLPVKVPGWRCSIILWLYYWSTRADVNTMHAVRVNYSEPPWVCTNTLYSKQEPATLWSKFQTSKSKDRYMTILNNAQSAWWYYLHIHDNAHQQQTTALLIRHTSEQREISTSNNDLIPSTHLCQRLANSLKSFVVALGGLLPHFPCKKSNQAVHEQSQQGKPLC